METIENLIIFIIILFFIFYLRLAFNKARLHHRKSILIKDINEHFDRVKKRIETEILNKKDQ